MPSAFTLMNLGHWLKLRETYPGVRSSVSILSNDLATIELDFVQVINSHRGSTKYVSAGRPFTSERLIHDAIRFLVVLQGRVRHLVRRCCVDRKKSTFSSDLCRVQSWSQYAQTDGCASHLGDRSDAGGWAIDRASQYELQFVNFSCRLIFFI